MDKNTEIRKLPAAAVFKLSQILDSGNAWQKVMAMIPSDPKNLESEAKYTLQDIKLIQCASNKQNRSCTEIMLDEWGTSGQVRANLNTLLQVLIRAQFYQAVEYVAVDLLKEQPPQRPQEGPAAAVPIPPITSGNSQGMIANIGNLLHIEYSTLKEITNDFDETPLSICRHSDGIVHSIGHKIGSGAFGSVYYGIMSDDTKVAIKKLSLQNGDLKNQFENEIRTLLEYRHKNLVPLYGFSCDTDNHCLVYEYMSNGSLLDRLQMKNVSTILCNSPNANKVLNGMSSNCNRFSGVISDDRPISWRRRVEIAADICEGINFLHNGNRYPLIHRDIKSANILLDERMTGKLGDFGLVKIKPNINESKLLTSNIFGTSAYMAPEAFRGDVSVKMDVFSYGVVLLELLTGLPPYDEQREGCDLVTYVEDVVEDSIAFLLDQKAGEWHSGVAQDLYNASKSCLEEKRLRPFIEEVRRRINLIMEKMVKEG